VRRWELVSGGSAKFWEVERDGSAVTVRFGRLGAAGQTQTKELASAEQAEAHVAKLVAEKEKKGYRATAATPASGPVATAPAADAGAVPLAAQADVQPAVAQQAVDEDTWTMPKTWLREVIRQRGFDPAPVFSLDHELVATARLRATEQVTTLDRLLAAPDSDPDLVTATREHLAGRPNPVGAAAVAAMTAKDMAALHHWIADHGLAFAVEALVESIGIFAGVKWIPQQNTQSDPHLYRYGGVLHASLDSTEGRMLTAARYALAVADEAERARVEAVLERLGTPDTPMVRAYLQPSRADWFAEACTGPSASGRWWMLPCSASTYDEFRAAPASVNNRATVLHTAVYVLGPAIAPLLAEDLDRAYQRAESRKQALKVLAALPTDEAFTILLDRLDTKYVRPALLSAMAAFPRRAARLLGERANGDEDARKLLTVHLATHPHLEAPAGFTPADHDLVPAASAQELPPVLATPPWVHRKPPVKPVVVAGLPVPEPSIVWQQGEREEWLNSGYWNTHHTWQHLLEEFRAGRSGYRARDLFKLAPEDEVRPLLADWRPNTGWGAEDTGKMLAARFGFDALPPLLRIVEASSNAAVVLLPFATPEVAALMADWFVRLKQVRKVALEWLARHRETAARFLVPAALDKPGAQRRNAEAAIRQLHAMGVDVVAAAPEAAAEGLRTLLSVDPVDVLPAKLPVLGEWADTRLLPQVLLEDRRSALSPEAAKNLLMTAALSKPGEVYAGLPVAREALDRDSLAAFAWAVFERWQEAGAPSKEGWALHALGWFGDDTTVRALSPLIRSWPGESQHAKAVTGLDVLADIGTEVALSHLNGIAEKVKFKALKTRAQEKVSQIAAELGLSRDQLADRLVPRLGLDDEASLVIDYGPRQFRVGFDEQLKPYVLDPDGKRRKDLPKPGAKDDQERAPLEHKRYAALKKDVRTIAADQIHRLERAMVDQRTWTAAEFHTVLAAHPLLWHIVRRLVWITDEGVSFRLAEDRTLADSGDDEFTLPETATVRVAHPVQLQESVEAWGEVFADYEILQPFPQLGRPLHVLPAGEDLLAHLEKYSETPYPVGKILSLTKKGWVRGEPQDAGVECWITRPLPGGGALVASLDPGIAVGAIDVFPEVKFTDIWYSANGSGYWSAHRNGTSTVAIDPITTSELLSELESLQP
jgi:predicted DNA-binding WGR domain protein